MSVPTPPRPFSPVSRPFSAALLVVILLVLVSSRTAHGGNGDRGEWSIAPWIGMARNSTADTFLGITPDRDHFMVGIHLATSVLRLGPLRLAYAPNITPLIVVTNNPVADWWISDERKAAVGAGFSPVGLQLDLDLTRRVTLFGLGSLGVLWFNRSVPVAGARAFNYAFEWGGGIRLDVARRSGVQIGYKFHHLSNAYTAPFNPGLDGNVYYAGLVWRVALPR